ncbi:MAG: aminomethyl transferase family protein [Acidobacteria bacterium]|nr:aminomethyl transferase family protein [Acidobacteriota bacterium]MBI3421513.1 aminomethyl transferase family protein [Acidobacteriota bacterium]
MTRPALQPKFTPQFDSTALLADYGDVRAEYEAIQHSTALIDLSPAGKLTINGKNAVQFINGLVSNDVKTLAAGAGVLAAFPNLQGKVAALASIYHTSDGLLLELDASNRAKIFKNLSRFVPAGEFFLTDMTEQLALFTLQGSRSAALLTALAGQPVEFTTARTITQTTLTGTPVQIAAHARTGQAGFDLFVPVNAAAAIRQALLTNGARAAGQTALDIARLEAGLPTEPADINENYIINETGLTEAVSYTKGCYLGQEVIARIHWRGQPAKQLRGLWIDATAPPAAGTELWATNDKGESKQVGAITSSVRSLALDRVIAFGYVHRYYLNAGTEFTLKHGETDCGRAQLAETPFVTTSNGN